MGADPAWVLGEAAAKITFDDSAVLHELSLAMAGQCRRTLDIASRQLDRLLYDNEPFVEAVKRIVLGSHYARIRILVQDSAALVGQEHRLIALANRLPSFIAVRKPGLLHKDFNEALLIADRLGYIHRRLADRYEGEANFCDRGQATWLAERFDEIWNHAIPDPELRALVL